MCLLPCDKSPHPSPIQMHITLAPSPPPGLLMKLAPYHFPLKGHILYILSPPPPAHHTATTGRSQISPKSGMHWASS